MSDEHGRILRDNVFGNQEEDATRRDFTINALFYDPTTEEILDFCGGLDDLKARRLRMIGDPEQRYREDPVRMLRAVRLAAKLGLKIEAETREPIKKLAPLLANVPSSRLFEEMMKLLFSGHATACLLQLRQEGLHHGLLPMLDVILEQPMGERFVMMALKSTDERVRADKPISPGFLFAALLWHEVLAAWKLAQEEGLQSDAGVIQGDGSRDPGAGGETLDPAPLRKRHEGYLGLAAALPRAVPAGGPTACSRIRVFAPATIFWCCVATAAKWTPKSPSGGKTSSMPTKKRASRCCFRTAVRAGAGGVASPAAAILPTAMRFPFRRNPDARKDAGGDCFYRPWQQSCRSHGAGAAGVHGTGSDPRAHW